MSEESDSGKPLMPRKENPLTLNEATAFLREAAVYFRRRDTNGEDRAHWSNVYNAENCERVIDLLFSMRACQPTPPPEDGR